MVDTSQQLMTFSLGQQLLGLADQLRPYSFVLVVETATSIAHALGHIAFLANRGGRRSHHLVALTFIDHWVRFTGVCVVQALN